jgi:hypothetical protein
MATVTGFRNHWHDRVSFADLWLRIQHFVWLSTAMFSAAALALAFLGFAWSGSFADGAMNYFASIASGTLFGLACIMKFGPNEP